MRSGEGPKQLAGVSETTTPYRATDSFPLDQPRLCQSLEMVEAALAKSSRRITTAQKARLVAQIYILLDMPEPPAGWTPYVAGIIEAGLTIQ